MLNRDLLRIKIEGCCEKKVLMSEPIETALTARKGQQIQTITTKQTHVLKVLSS
jgi:hypothetical protein